MLERLAAWVLNTYVGEYVENLNTDQLSIALLQGAVELENLPLKKDALRRLDLPLSVKSGFIGKITLQIPLRRLHSEPWVISIEKLYLVAGPLQNVQYDEEKEKSAEAARKTQMLLALNAELQGAEKQESSWFSYGTSVLANILENLQLNVKDVHIRYEDNVTNPTCPFAFGVVINKLSAQSTDASWIPRFVSRDNVELMHKLLNLENFSIYFDTNTTLVGHLPKDKMAEHEYILSPISATAQMKRYTTPLPLREPSIPRNTIDLNLANMAFTLTEDQYRNIIILLREFSNYEKSKRYRKWKPNCPVKDNGEKWWQFAIQTKLFYIQDRNRRLTKTFLVQRVKDVNIYTKLYTAQLKKSYMDPKMKSDQKRIEEEWSFDEIKIVRVLVYRRLKRQGALDRATTPEPMSKTTKPDCSPSEEKSFLQRWFPGWGGWYSSQTDVQTTKQGTQTNTHVSERHLEEPDTGISRSEFEQELREEIDYVLGDGEADKSILKKDTVFAKLNFCLNTGSFSVLGTRPLLETGGKKRYSILELKCSIIEMMFESRPRTSGLLFSISVGSLELIDTLTKNSQFPCLIGLQNKGFGPKRQTCVQGLQKTNITIVKKESNLKFFELTYEKNPLHIEADFRFSVLAQPLDIVYNISAFKRVSDMFSSSNMSTFKNRKASITAAARRQYETYKSQTAAELNHSLIHLLEGSGKEKAWEIHLDVAGPQIIIPESFESENTHVVVLDLGHLKFHNSQLSAEIPSNTFTRTVSDEEFFTPMSTPPNEPTEEKYSPSHDMEQIIQLDRTEAQIHRKIYDQYTLELTDLQVMAGRTRDNWKHIHHPRTTSLHLVDKFSISLQLERRLIYTTDPQWPTVMVSGSLPSLTIHVNEQKVQAINACVGTLSSQQTGTGASVNQSSSSHSLSESSSGLNITDLGVLTHEDLVDTWELIDKENIENKLRDLVEESELVLFEFNFKYVCLEIHSKERPIAELQVSGVKTSLTKRPYDTNIKLAVHSLLVLDALQTYGQDFDLLIDSHRNVRLNSTSGSMSNSVSTSPILISPESPPGFPMEQVRAPLTTSEGLTSEQELMNQGNHILNVTRSTTEIRHSCTSPAPDSEALIVIEFNMIAANSPSNTSIGPLNVANLQFNNLDIIANQETAIELVSFLKRTMPQSKDSKLQTKNQPTNNILTVNQSLPLETKRPRTEMTAEFNRMSIMMMRLDESSGAKKARKVATATMSCARVQTSIDTELRMTGSLGGFHVFDITPENKRHRRLFSVGQDTSDDSHQKSAFIPREMYKTTCESMMFGLGGYDKAFTFSLSKPLCGSEQKRYPTRFNSSINDSNCIQVNLQVASLCYIHSPGTVFELSLCFSEFEEYKRSVTRSLKSVASEVAKGMIAKKVEMNQNSMLGNCSSSKRVGGSKSKLNQNADKYESECFENEISVVENESQNLKILLDAFLDSPLIIVPKSDISAQVLVTHLGEITISNTEYKSQGHLSANVLTENDDSKADRIFMEVRNMNLYAANIEEIAQKNTSAINVDNSLDYRSLSASDDIGTPIVYNTTIHVTVDHIVGSNTLLNGSNEGEFPGDYQPKDVNDSVYFQDTQPLLDMKAKIQTPLKVVLLKSVYEQILQTIEYMSSADSKMNESDQNVNQNAANTATQSGIQTGSQDEIKKSMQSSRMSSLNQSRTEKAFVTKKLRFEVPLFSVELRGDFGEGESGVVELKLNRFLMDFYKDNPATTKVEVSLKSIVMDDLLESPESPHRQIIVSKVSQSNDLSNMRSREFLFQSGTLSRDELMEENLVYISVLLVDQASPEYKEMYNETNRFTDVNFNCLETKINQQTWVKLLDFLGLGAKVHDVDILAGKESETRNNLVDHEMLYSQPPVVNSKTNVKIEYLSIVLNKEEYVFAEVNISKMKTQISLRDGNMGMKCQLGKIYVLDLSPSGELYKERFSTVGNQSLQFDFFKYGIPDPDLKRDFDMSLKLRMSSVRYTHTNKFQAEMLGFVQHFLQLQDVLGRMRAAHAGIKINEQAFHIARILFDIEAGSPIILIPHSFRTTDVLVADFGILSVKTCFKLDGDPGTYNAQKQSAKSTNYMENQNMPGSVSRSSHSSNVTKLSKTPIVIEGDVPMNTERRRCLLQILDVCLCNIDLFSAERVEKRNYKGNNLQQDLEFPSCVIQRQGCTMLKKKCMLDLHIERNLDGDFSHAVPDFRVQGALSSVHCCLDIAQYKLIRGLLDHNLGEKFENFKKDLLTNMQNQVIQTKLSEDVWTMMSMVVDLHNVTLELLSSHQLNNSTPEVSLSKLDFIRTRLLFDLFSDQSIETDLVSQEILASDTRFIDAEVSLKTSKFEKILSPSESARPNSLQLELHYRASTDNACFLVILNNMKLLCSFDWMIALQEFINTKPDDPFQTGPTQGNSSPRVPNPALVAVSTFKRTEPVSKQTEVPFEFRLNVIDTEFAMVENLADADTNAVILKCTSVLSYHPNAADMLLSCSLQSLEVFSCSPLGKEESALSIVDPFSMSIDLNANPLSLLEQNVTANVVEGAECDNKIFQLEINCEPINVRVSYQDMKMFLAIMDSLPKQALKARQQAESPVSQLTESQISQLTELNFSREDCIKALKVNRNNVDDAAIWLTEYAKVPKTSREENTINVVKINLSTFSMCLIDDCLDADVPLIQLNFFEVQLNYESGGEGKAGFKIAGDYYNRTLTGWEPLIEQWRCDARWKIVQTPEAKLVVDISALDVLNINITSTFLDLYNKTKAKWTDDYYNKLDRSQKEVGAAVSKRRQLFLPYTLRNQTGSQIWYLPLTVNPSHGSNDTDQFTDMIQVPPNEEMMFSFHRKEKIRHKKLDSPQVNQLVVKVDGWQRLSPVSVNKEGVYFRNTLPDSNEQQPARVVFDIKQEGSARKVITLRSALMVVNKLDSPIELINKPGRDSNHIIGAYERKSVPMTCVHSSLWIRPYNQLFESRYQQISWQNVMKPGEIKDGRRECQIPNWENVNSFCVEVKHEQYPDNPVIPGYFLIPAHTVKIMPLVTVLNLLPLDLHYDFKGTNLHGYIKPGKLSQIHAIARNSILELFINLKYFIQREGVVINIAPLTISEKVNIRLYDSLQRLLVLQVEINKTIGGSLKLSISAPFWLVNRSELSLVFREFRASIDTARQISENETTVFTPIPDMHTSPLRLAFIKFNRNRAGRCKVRVGNHGTDTFAAWVFYIGVETKPGKALFRNTRIVTFSPRYFINNMSDHKIAIAQIHLTNKEKLQSPDDFLTVMPNCKMPFHWPRQDLDQLLCVKLLDVEDCNWSGGFRIDAVNNVIINMRDSQKSCILLKVEVLLQGQTFYVCFLNARDTPPPYRLDNMSEVPVLFFQTNTNEERLLTKLEPQTTFPYALDESTVNSCLTLSVPYGTTATYNLDNLDKLRECKQLKYQNIYICATASILKNRANYDNEHQDLVLVCESGKCKFRRRVEGKMSQLWRLTNQGMLQHEGMRQPADPTSSGSRLVLDIDDFTALTLKKKDKKGALHKCGNSRFNGMLCSQIGNFCVQAVLVDGRLQDGALAILDERPQEGNHVPDPMQMSCQKLQPGSGCLTVRAIMDGPVMVLQINDVQQRKIRKIVSKDEEDQGINEESHNNKPNESIKQPLQRNIELNFDLKFDLGISLVNSVPEELLYMTLKNITINYTLNSSGTRLNISVADIQADNQLFDASRSVMLFVTPNSNRGAVENEYALLISAHKLSDTRWNADIYKELDISMKNFTIHLEEKLLWKLLQFARISQSHDSLEKIEFANDNLMSKFSSEVSVKTKRVYVRTLHVSSTCITISFRKSTGELEPDLANIRRTTWPYILVDFEDIVIKIDPFQKTKAFESIAYFETALIQHYLSEITANAPKILFSLNVTGDLRGLANDVAAGFSGLTNEGNVSGLAKGIVHGVSNSAAKMTGSVSYGLSFMHMDKEHNLERQQIQNSAKSGGSQFMSGVMGLRHGLFGGVKSIVKPFKGAANGGFKGFVKGLYQGVTGIVTKPVVGVLDFASGISSGLRDATQSTHGLQPNRRVRESRCCHGPGGLLQTYCQPQALAQELLYMLNDHQYDEKFIVVEKVKGNSTNCHWVMITSNQVYYLQNTEHPIIFKHEDYTQCLYIENDEGYFLELSKTDNETECKIPCENKMTALKVLQQINNAKNLFEEQKMRLNVFEDDDDE